MTEPTLTMTLEGREYVVPSPEAAVGLALQASWVVAQARRAGKEPPQYAVARQVQYDNGEADLDRDALGPVWDQMIEDKVSIIVLRRAALAAYLWIATGSTAKALALWDGKPADGGGDAPKAWTTTGGANTTKKRASTSGTTSRRKKSKG